MTSHAKQTFAPKFAPAHVAAVAALVAMGVVGLSQPAPAAPAVSDAATIPVTITTASPVAASSEGLCQAAMEAVATGQPVPVSAAPCLRAFLLEADEAAGEANHAQARPAPEACEALLPAIATGQPVMLGAAVPCIEDYMTGGGQVAAR
ncbi:hypothetical protein [Roseospira visakhapatnamensis]|uniref:Uncharacterized protein n=1 Tax=Roseospira visakhapatnamensis TaxID=390880 RepID=A0A7W6WBJ8_9PROT|nr:hypothetical protein [Roseospira visakhapatnamensis]MBB4268099.1 hypothetical protein [Roseospira visakhapatnamensis]